MSIEALPWFLVGILLLILGIELLVSDRAAVRQQAEIGRLVQQAAIDQAAVNEARTAFHRVRVERDLARDTVRNLIDINREAGLRLSRSTPLPMPPDLDDAITDEFTKVVERNTWPEWPDNGGRS